MKTIFALVIGVTLTCCKTEIKQSAVDNYHEIPTDGYVDTMKGSIPENSAPQPYTKYVLVTMDIVTYEPETKTIEIDMDYPYPHKETSIIQSSREVVKKDLHIFTLQFDPDENVEERMAMVMDLWEKELLKPFLSQKTDVKNRKYYLCNSYIQASNLRQTMN